MEGVGSGHWDDGRNIRGTKSAWRQPVESSFFPGARCHVCAQRVLPALGYGAEIDSYITMAQGLSPKCPEDGENALGGVCGSVYHQW